MKKKNIIIATSISLFFVVVSLFAMLPINNTYENGINPWMSYVEDNTKINELTIPGTHDSGATHSIFDVAGKCQDLTIEQQLRIGTRFFDLRLQLIGEEFSIFHGPVDQGLKFDVVLNDLVNFVKEYDSEFLLISIKKENDDKNNTRSFKEVLTEKLNEYSEIISFSNEIPNTVKEARGKIYIIDRYGIDIGYPAYSNWVDDATFTLNNLYIQDDYCVNNAEEKITAIENTFNYSKENKGAYLYLNYSSCYFDNSFPPTYAGTAAYAINPWLINYLENDNYKSFGIVIVDFITKDLAEIIYRRNY